MAKLSQSNEFKINVLRRRYAARCLSILFGYLLAISSLAAKDLGSLGLSSLELSNQLDLGRGDAVIVQTLQDARDQNSDAQWAWNKSAPLIPASTIKILTAYLALQKLGAEHRFHTDFYLFENELWVKGYGDPFLTSEELERVASEINNRLVSKDAKRGLRLRLIGVDGSRFSQSRVPGNGNQFDPYNAPLSAVSANFNTAKVKVNADGRFESAEMQTPLTSTAVRVANGYSKKAIESKGDAGERINLQTSENAQRHFAEILSAKLGGSDVLDIKLANTPKGAELLYRHYNSKPLSEQLTGALFYSNNFIANQIFMMLSVDELGAEKIDSGSLSLVSLNLDDASRYVDQKIGEQFGWQQYQIEEGAGLSRANRVSAKQLSDVLRVFHPHKHLLREYQYKVKGRSIRVHAKTGTLSRVRTLAGYFSLNQKEYLFVILLNENQGFRHREAVLKQLISKLVDDG